MYVVYYANVLQLQCTACSNSVNCDEDLNLEEVWELNNRDEDEIIANDGLQAFPDKRFSIEANSSAKAILSWTVGFLLIWQTRNYVSDNAMSIMVNFLSTWLRVLGKFSPFVSAIGEVLCDSVKELHKKADLNSFTRFVVCPKCHKIYQFEECVAKDGEDRQTKLCNYIQFPTHPHMNRRQPCKYPLLKTVEIKTNNQTPPQKKLFPFKEYCYQSLESSLRKLLLRKQFIDGCAHWKTRQNFVSGEAVINDVYDGQIWKEFCQRDGVPFLEKDDSFALILNVDWFQPFTHTQYSIGVIYLTVLNLPRYIRYKQENTILIGIIPGPREPKLTINTYLRPLVDELLKFWNGVTLPVYTTQGIKDKIVRAALLCISCDLPAAAKVCGYLGHSANLSCFKCLKVSPGEVGKKDYSGFERSTWQKRTDHQHRRAVRIINRCRTKASKQKKETKFGCRYSCLLDLPYFDVTRMLCIDPMHNLFLGTGKHMLSIWKDQGWLNRTQFEAIQKFVDEVSVPADIGRIPYKIQSGFASFKADQFKSWILIYSIPALHGILPIEHLECWRHFVLACRILCKHSLTLADIDLADALLLRFCKRVQEIYGSDVITPNFHLHPHLRDVILDYGPADEFWLFSFERYNGILGKQTTNNRAIEPQLMKKFIKSSFTESLTFPKKYEEEFSLFVTSDQEVIRGSVGDSSVSTARLHCWANCNLTLPNIYNRDAFDMETVGLLKMLLSKISQCLFMDDLTVNALYSKYSSITLNGKVYSSSIRQRKGNCIIQAVWKEEYYGNMPTMIPEAYTPGSNIRPVMVHYYSKVFFSIGTTKNTQMFAYVSWLLPHSQRYYLGKPAELWFNGQYEGPGIHSFVPIDCVAARCAYGNFCHEGENLTVVVPLVT